MPGAPSISYHLPWAYKCLVPTALSAQHMLLAPLATPWPSQLGSKKLIRTFSQRLSDCLGLPEQALGWGLGMQPRRCTETLLLVGDTLLGGYNPVIRNGCGPILHQGHFCLGKGGAARAQRRGGIIYLSQREGLLVVPSLSPVRPFATLWTAERQTSLPWRSISPGVCLNSYPLVGDAIQPSLPLWEEERQPKLSRQGTRKGCQGVTRCISREGGSKSSRPRAQHGQRPRGMRAPGTAGVSEARGKYCIGLW